MCEPLPGNMFAVFTSRPPTNRYAEMGSSAAILAAGYNIDSLMLRYQGVDWRDKANWGCNAGWVANLYVCVLTSDTVFFGPASAPALSCSLVCPGIPLLPLGSNRRLASISPPPPVCSINPYAEYMYDGVNLSPFEVMFVKVGRRAGASKGRWLAGGGGLHPVGPGPPVGRRCLPLVACRHAC